MKKILLVLVLIVLFPFTVNAFEIERLGLKSNDLENITFETRDNMKDSYSYYINNMYAFAENDDYKVYIRAIQNPIDHDFTPSADLMDDVFGLIGNLNTNEYSFITNKNFKWIRFLYNTKDSNTPLLEYYLSYKDIFFTITFVSKKSEFTFTEKTLMDEFVKSITLTGKGKVEVSPIYPEGIDQKPKTYKNNLFIEIIVCVLAIALTYLITRRKK